MNYSVIDKKILRIVYKLPEYKHILYSKKVDAYLDNKNLIYNYTTHTSIQIQC